MEKQRIIWISGKYSEIDECLQYYNVHRIMLVCGHSIEKLRIFSYFQTLQEKIGIEIVWFQDFQPNPKSESIIGGVKLFQEKMCDLIIAVGGGSAMDVAKCIKLFCEADTVEGLFNQRIIPNKVRFWAMPTTSGSGSESTQFAVIYDKGEKKSVTDISCIPSVVLMDSTVLRTVPIYQKKVTMMDAFCHALESFWSVNSTKESKRLSQVAISTILKYQEKYLKNYDDGNRAMLKAANIAGRAINIAKTTAGHAMSYKLTSLYGISHGHAVALCIARLWPYMVSHIDRCIDYRGKEYLKKTFQEIAVSMSCATIEEAIELYCNMLAELGLLQITLKDREDLEILSKSVNQERLQNHPIQLQKREIYDLYCQMFGCCIINGGK